MFGISPLEEFDSHVNHGAILQQLSDSRDLMKTIHPQLDGIVLDWSSRESLRIRRPVPFLWVFIGRMRWEGLRCTLGLCPILCLPPIPTERRPHRHSRLDFFHL